MPRYRLTIAYDGTDFCGWQKQEPPTGQNIAAAKVMGVRESVAEGDSAPEGGVSRLTLRTVQEVVERAVRQVVREPVVLAGASRTDSGVHARGQVAAFTASEAAWPASRGTMPLLRAINSRLPEDVQIVAAEEAEAEFNPISGAVDKGYSYLLFVSPHRPLWERRYVHHLWVPLEINAMNEAAAALVGEHDFAGFAAAGHGRLSTVRTVFACTVRDEGPAAAAHGATTPEWARRYRIEVSGSGFLWNMVRIIAGTLVEVGKGRLTLHDVEAALLSGDRRRAGPTLGPEGLCLEWIRYT